MSLSPARPTPSVRRAAMTACCLSALLALPACSDTGSGAETQAGLQRSAECGADDHLLGKTGLCAAEAATLIQQATPDGIIPERFDDCTWSVNETGFPGNEVLVYRAALCGEELAALGGGFGAQTAQLYVANSAVGDAEGEDSIKFTIYGADPADPLASILAAARQAMAAEGVDAAYIETCKVRPAPEYGTDAYVVDTEDYNAVSDDGPRNECGPLGLEQDATSFWRSAYGYSIFVQLGQDMNQDFDPNSLTLLTQSDAGNWQPVAPLAEHDVNADIPGEDDNFGVVNIVGTEGAEDTAAGTSGDWSIVKGTIEGAAEYCYAEKTFDGTPVRVGWDDMQWQLAIAHPVPADFYGNFDVDGHTSGMSWTPVGDWALAWLGLMELEPMKEGQTLTVDLDGKTFTLPLSGLAEATAKVETCLSGNMVTPE